MNAQCLLTPLTTTPHLPISPESVLLKDVTSAILSNFNGHCFPVPSAVSSSSDRALSLASSSCYALCGWSHFLSWLQMYVNDYQIYISCLSFSSELQTCVANYWPDTSMRIISRHPQINRSTQISLLPTSMKVLTHSESVSYVFLNWPFLFGRGTFILVSACIILCLDYFNSLLCSLCLTLNQSPPDIQSENVAAWTSADVLHYLQDKVQFPSWGIQEVAFCPLNLIFWFLHLLPQSYHL